MLRSQVSAIIYVALYARQDSVMHMGVQAAFGSACLTCLTWEFKRHLVQRVSNVGRLSPRFLPTVAQGTLKWKRIAFLMVHKWQTEAVGILCKAMLALQHTGR
jgi:hypothetical protein